jgi:hypothetical protein
MQALADFGCALCALLLLCTRIFLVGFTFDRAKGLIKLIISQSSRS